MTFLTRILRPCPLRVVTPAERVQVAAASRAVRSAVSPEWWRWSWIESLMWLEERRAESNSRRWR